MLSSILDESGCSPCDVYCHRDPDNRLDRGERGLVESVDGIDLHIGNDSCSSFLLYLVCGRVEMAHGGALRGAGKVWEFAGHQGASEADRSDTKESRSDVVGV